MVAINKQIPPSGQSLVNIVTINNADNTISTLGIITPVWLKWLSIVAGSLTTYLIAGNNLSDVTSASTARTNLGVPNLTGTGASGTWAITAANVTTNANLTGVVTSVGNATSIANSAITNAMLANTAVANLTGTNSGDQTISDATISTTDITTNNASTSKHGFLKKLDNTATHYQDGTGNWSTPAGTNAGTVTSITAGTGLTGGTITTSGTIAISKPLGTLSAIMITMATNQSIPAATFTKVKFDTRSFDLNTDYDPTTNYRWTPQVAGTYFITSAISFAPSTANALIENCIYKNGSQVGPAGLSQGPLNNYETCFISQGVQMNGTTDYIEIYFYQGDALATNVTGAGFSNLSGFRLPGS